MHGLESLRRVQPTVYVAVRAYCFFPNEPFWMNDNYAIVQVAVKQVSSQIPIGYSCENMVKYNTRVAMNYGPIFYLGTGHYLYPGLGLKRNYFELKKLINPTINNGQFSNTPPFISV